MRFEKWQALGNDYLLVEADALTFEPQAPAIRTLLARHTGIDADGLIVLHRDPEPDVVARLEIYNPDGSRAELSGNGARQAIIYLRTRGWTDADEFVVRTDAGLLRPTITGPDSCTVDMGSAALASADFPSGTPDGRGASTPAVAAGSSSTYRSAIRSARSMSPTKRSSRPWTCPRSVRRSKARRSSRIAATSRGTANAAPRRFAPGSSSAVSARRFRRGPARPARRSRTSHGSAGRPAACASCSTAGRCS